MAANEAWATFPVKLEASRSCQKALVFDDESKILFIGGFGNYGHAKRSLEILDLVSQSITKVAYLPWGNSNTEFRSKSSFCIVGDHVYVCAGLGGNMHPLDEVYRMNLRGLSPSYTVGPFWEPLQPMNEAREEAPCVSVHGKIYVISGTREEVVSSECFDPLNNNWHTLPPMPQARIYAAVATIKNEIYVLGGFKNGESTLNVNVFNANTNSWRSTVELPLDFDMSGFYTFSISRWLVVIGKEKFDNDDYFDDERYFAEDEESYDDPTYTRCFILDTKTSQWIEASPIFFATNRCDPAYAVVNRDQIYRIGGTNSKVSYKRSGHYIDSIEYISFETLSGITLPWSLLKPRFLVEQRRAIATSHIEDVDLSIIQHFIADTEEDIFRFTLEFL